MRMYDLIEKKKLGQELSTEEIKDIIDGYTRGDIPDYQISALLMAICFNGMNVRERYDLTMAMRDSGDILDLSSIDGVKIDKHSTGGVGDKVTLVLGPIIASIGVPVAKMSMGLATDEPGSSLDFNSSAAVPLRAGTFMPPLERASVSMTPGPPA